MWTRKRLIYAFIIVLVAALVVSSLMKGNGVVAATALLEKENLVVSIQNEGQTRLVDSYLVSAPITGEMERVSVQVGDRVEQGGTLFRVAPIEISRQQNAVLQANVRAAEARLKNAHHSVLEAENTLELAQSSLTRHQALFQDEIVTKEQLEVAESNAKSAGRALDSSQQQVIAAEADFEAAKSSLISTTQQRQDLTSTVVAPTAGRVLRIFERNQTSIVAGSPVMEIGNADRLELVVDVLSEDAVQISTGNRVWITGWGGEALTGNVRSVEPAAFTKVSALGVEEQRVNVVIDFDTIPETLGVGYRAEASIVIQETPNALAIPVSSIFQESGSWFAFVVVNDTVEKRPIKLSTRAADRVAVDSGLVEGDEVVLYPSASIEAGVKIKR